MSASKSSYPEKKVVEYSVDDRVLISPDTDRVMKHEVETYQHTLMQGTKKQPEPTILALFRRSDRRKLDQIATQPSVFDDPKQAKHHQPNAKYENLHRFDPNFRWTWREEIVSITMSRFRIQCMLTYLVQSLVRKLDWKVMVFAWFAYLALQLDNSCLIQAQADNFLKDLNMNTNGMMDVHFSYHDMKHPNPC